MIQDLKSCQRVLQALQYTVDMTPANGMSSYVAWEAYSEVEINMRETFSECSWNQIVGKESVLDSGVLGLQCSLTKAPWRTLKMGWLFRVAEVN